MKYQFSNYSFSIHYINRFHNILNSHKYTIHQLLEIEEDEKKFEQYEKDLKFISNFESQLMKYENFLATHYHYPDPDDSN